MTVAFVLIAAGNSLAGILSSRVSRTFGEPTYSLYLVHGIVLYVTFKFILSGPVAQGLSTAQHWWVLWALTPVVIILSRMLFRFVELTGMDLPDRFPRWTPRRRNPGVPNAATLPVPAAEIEDAR